MEAQPLPPPATTYFHIGTLSARVAAWTHRAAASARRARCLVLRRCEGPAVHGILDPASLGDVDMHGWQRYLLVDAERVLEDAIGDEERGALRHRAEERRGESVVEGPNAALGDSCETIGP